MAIDGSALSEARKQQLTTTAKMTTSLPLCCCGCLFFFKGGARVREDREGRHGVPGYRGRRSGGSRRRHARPGKGHAGSRQARQDVHHRGQSAQAPPAFLPSCRSCVLAMALPPATLSYWIGGVVRSASLIWRRPLSRSSHTHMVSRMLKTGAIHTCSKSRTCV